MYPRQNTVFCFALSAAGSSTRPCTGIKIIVQIYTCLQCMIIIVVYMCVCISYTCMSPCTLCFCCLVSDLIPLLAMSPGLILEQPFLRSNGQSLILKTSHVCQWLEIAASYYTSLTVQALLSRKRKMSFGWQIPVCFFISFCVLPPIHRPSLSISPSLFLSLSF